MTKKCMARIDMHRNNLFCAIVDLDGKRVFEQKLPCDLASHAGGAPNRLILLCYVFLLPNRHDGITRRRPLWFSKNAGPKNAGPPPKKT